MTTTFNTNDYDLIYQDGVEATYWSRARNNIIYRSIKSAGLKRLPIIEVGCGRGIVTRFLIQKGVDCIGVELAEIPPVSGVEGKVITGKNALDFDTSFKSKFKALMLLDVIEHLEDDYDFVNKLLQAYGNVEYLIVAVPARKEIWSNFDDFYRHFRRYDMKMVNELMDKLGYEIKSERYFFNFVYFMIWLQNKLNIKRKLDNLPPKGAFSKMIHKIVASGFVLEYLIMPGKFYGSSIMCIARKKK